VHRITPIIAWLDGFLLNCSGARADVLQLEPFHGERGKFRALGSTVLLDSAAVALSAGYAISMVSPSTLIIGATCFLMGFTFLNLQRAVFRLFDSGNRRFTLAAVIASIGLSALFALVIVRPLELGLFAREIDARIPGNTTPSLLRQLVVLQQLKSEVPAIRWTGTLITMMFVTMLGSAYVIKWLSPVSAAYKSYVTYEEQQTIERIHTGAYSEDISRRQSEEVLQALDDATQTAERIIRKLDDSHEIVRRSFIFSMEKNG
jgi:hypothetical protein